MVSERFTALANEAEFTREMLCSGATQIRGANYASRGIYFQAFTSLSTGLERIGKLCLMLDHYLDHNGKFPDANYMEKEICHKISLIYERSESLIARRSISMRFLQKLENPIHQGILTVLSEFAKGDRYCNINLLVGRKRQGDPTASWFKQVDQPLYEACVPKRKKLIIQNNAEKVAELLGPHSLVRFTSETGSAISEIEEASYRTGMYEAVAPFRQLYVLQIIRYWVELLYGLQDLAMRTDSEDIPYFGDMFARFYNPDSYFRTRKTWDRL